MEPRGWLLYGEYTFLGSAGDPYYSATWNYLYDHYSGFIHIEQNGNALKQRNLFVYPPQSADTCDANNAALGEEVCGSNGNEKTFAADQSASDCDGNLAGRGPVSNSPRCVFIDSE